VTPESEPEPEERQDPHGDRVPESDDRRDELVDHGIDESFPASDPPSYWGRDTSDDAPPDDR
jgi:hypothetical protein